MREGRLWIEQEQTGSKVCIPLELRLGALNLVSRSQQRIDIQPGMTATVEIKTGSNTVLRYLTKPITKTISESLGER